MEGVDLYFSRGKAIGLEVELVGYLAWSGYCSPCLAPAEARSLQKPFIDV